MFALRFGECKMPDSLHAAAKVLATALDIPWTELQRTYRGLQEAPRGHDVWLPKSLGRNIYYADPNFITRLLVAHLCAPQDVEEARSTLQWMTVLTRGGRAYGDDKPAANIKYPIEREFARYLTEPKEADKLVEVQIHPDNHLIIFSNASKSVKWLPASDAENLPPKGAARIRKQTVISGDVFRDLAANIEWVGAGPAFKKVQQGGVD
jgi:hypothetical protein